MKKILILFVMALSLILIPSVLADYSVKIDMKNNFKQGEKINFNYTIDLNLQGEVEYMVGIRCDDLPDSLLDIRKITLDSGEEITGNYEGKEIDKYYENCFSYISVISPVEITAKKNFNILAVSEFNFDLRTCKDRDCLEKSNIFLLNEKIYLGYSSEVENPERTATLTSPSGKSKDIQIPSTLKLNEIGTYTINVQASKQGYKTMQVSKQIGIIEQEADIPQRVLGSAITTIKEKGDGSWIFVIGLIILLLIIIFLIYKKIKSNKEIKDEK